MVRLTARQSTLIFGWFDPRPTLAWSDVVRLGLSLDTLISYRLSSTDILTIQPDPAQWAQHASAGLKHARFLGANPFLHLGADLADVMGMNLTVVEMLRMGITHAQLRSHGMTERMEGFFKFDEVEWQLLGKK
jgi:hypothetical protein